MSNTTARGPARPVTTVKPLQDDSPLCMFAVQPGVPLTDAYDAIGLLVGTARLTLIDASFVSDETKAAGGGAVIPGSVFAAQCLLELAMGLHESMYAAILQAGGGAH